jgi:predicted lipoprotein
VRALGVVVGLAGCGASPSRSEVLAELARDGIVPAYEQVAADADGLAGATTELCDDPDAAGLEAARKAMAKARSSWSYTQAAWVGPVMDRRSWAVIDWPVEPAEIDAVVADPQVALTDDYLGTRVGADQRGLGAVEYLLGNDQAALARLGDKRHCDYLVAAAAVISAEAAAVAGDWAESWDDGDPYVEVFTDPGTGSLDTVVSDTLFLLEAMTDAELGRAIGAAGEPTDPSAIVEGPAGLGVADLGQRLAGVQAVLVGDGTQPGLSPLLGEDLTERLGQELDAAAAAVADIDGPLRAATIESPDQVAAARDALKAVQVTVTTEVVSRLGVTVGFSDADGDSG